MIDLGQDSKFKRWDKFQTAITDLGEASGWKNNLILVDSAHRIQVMASLSGLGEGRGGVKLTDSAEYFHPPSISRFENGLDRVALSPEQAGVVYDAQPSGDFVRGADCNGISEINGRIYYQVQMWEMPVDKETGEGMTHTLDWLLVDASDGTKWQQDITYEGMHFRGKKAKTRFLREGVDSAGVGWRLLSGSCDKEESAHIWQYRRDDRRLQSIKLAPVNLMEDLLLDTMGVAGQLVQILDPAIHSDLSSFYFLVRDREMVAVVRSGNYRLFNQRWDFPDPGSRLLANDLSVDESNPGLVRLKISGMSYSVIEADWMDISSLKKHESPAATCDTCSRSSDPAPSAKVPRPE